MAVTRKKPATSTSKKSSKAAPARKAGATARKKSAPKTETKTMSKTKPAARKDTPARAKATRKATKETPLTLASGQLPYLGIAPYKEKKGEAYMGPAQVEHFRNILNTWKGKLIEEMERTVHHMRDDAANFPDPNDRASQESDFALELRTRDRERKLVKKIDEALRNLDNNEYGFCETCGVEIGIRRLEARPTATLCIDCKTLDEIRERQIKG